VRPTIKDNSRSIAWPTSVPVQIAVLAGATFARSLILLRYDIHGNRMSKYPRKKSDGSPGVVIDVMIAAQK
jgi:hypothetical protein